MNPREVASIKNLINDIKGNYPFEEICAFRESGYINELSNTLSIKLADEYELYIYFKLSKWKGDNLRLATTNKKKIVLCVGDESTDVDYSFTDEVDSIFRTYLPASLDGKSKFNHLAVGPSSQFIFANTERFEARPYNVFFSGNLHVGRANLYRALTNTRFLPFALLHRVKRLIGINFDTIFPNSIIRFGTGFHNGISPSEYAAFMRDSKICLCPAGVENPETMRHFEAAQMGTIVVTTPLPNVPIYKEAPFVVLSSWRELQKTIKRLLNEPNKMLDLHCRTLHWWQNQASAEAVATAVHEKIRAKG